VRVASKRTHALLALAACSVLAACTTSSEQIRGDVQPIASDKFRYVSTATMMHPVDSRQGEHYRMTNLASLLQQRGLCPGGYVIESRDPPLFFNKDSRYEYAVRDVTYIGRCK
jgi:hypothetical protein